MSCNERRTVLQHGFHLMAKPAGPACNLRCSYCFYYEKEQYFPNGQPFLMSDQVLESYIREYIAAQAGPEVVFDWQGGEPTLAGVDFFQQALALQKKYAQGKKSATPFRPTEPCSMRAGAGSSPATVFWSV